MYDYLIKNLKPVAKGVKASTYKNYSYTDLKLSEVEWVKIEVVDVDGRKKIIYVSKKY